jgi:hypothetical protein
MQCFQKRETALQSRLFHRSAKTGWEVFASRPDDVASDETTAEPNLDAKSCVVFHDGGRNREPGPAEFHKRIGHQFRDG